MIRPAFTFVFTLLFLSGTAQIKDSTVFSPHLSFHYAYQWPGGDMADRFGEFSNVGASFNIKDKHNFYYGVDFSYMFGARVTEPGLMQNLYTENGEILDNQGQISEVLVEGRGFTVTLSGGYLFNFPGPNPNSGLLLKGGVGLLQHRIRLENQVNEINQLDGDYEKGYDRMTNGLVLSQFLGYYYMSNSRLANFYVGFEAYQGFTQSQRGFNFDTQQVDNEKRMDQLFGIRAGWIIHLRKRAPKDYYIY